MSRDTEAGALIGARRAPSRNRTTSMCASGTHHFDADHIRTDSRCAREQNCGAIKLTTTTILRAPKRIAFNSTALPCAAPLAKVRRQCLSVCCKCRATCVAAITILTRTHSDMGHRSFSLKVITRTRNGRKYFITCRLAPWRFASIYRSLTLLLQSDELPRPLHQMLGRLQTGAIWIPKPLHHAAAASLAAVSAGQAQ